MRSSRKCHSCASRRARVPRRFAVSLTKIFQNFQPRSIPSKCPVTSRLWNKLCSIYQHELTFLILCPQHRHFAGEFQRQIAPRFWRSTSGSSPCLRWQRYFSLAKYTPKYVCQITWLCLTNDCADDMMIILVDQYAVDIDFDDFWGHGCNSFERCQLLILIV